MSWECFLCGLKRDGTTKPDGWSSIIFYMPQDGRTTERMVGLHSCENQRCIAANERLIKALGSGVALVTG